MHHDKNLANAFSSLQRRSTQAVGHMTWGMFRFLGWYCKQAFLQTAKPDGGWIRKVNVCISWAKFSWKPLFVGADQQLNIGHSVWWDTSSSFSPDIFTTRTYMTPYGPSSHNCGTSCISHSLSSSLPLPPPAVTFPSWVIQHLKFLNSILVQSYSSATIKGPHHIYVCVCVCVCTLEGMVTILRSILLMSNYPVGETIGQIAPRL